MNENSLGINLSESQGERLIYCPMCQETHKNNTLCQMNDQGGCHEIF